MWLVSLVTRPMFGHCYMNEVYPYVCISDRIWFTRSELVKWVKTLQRFVGVVQVGLELGFKGVIWVNEPVLPGGASANRTGELSRVLGAVKSLTGRSTWYNQPKEPSDQFGSREQGVPWTTHDTQYLDTTILTTVTDEDQRTWLLASKQAWQLLHCLPTGMAKTTQSCKHRSMRMAGSNGINDQCPEYHFNKNLFRIPSKNSICRIVHEGHQMEKKHLECEHYVAVI